MASVQMWEANGVIGAHIYMHDLHVSIYKHVIALHEAYLLIETPPLRHSRIVAPGIEDRLPDVGSAQTRERAAHFTGAPT
jgi:hypothetical protein